MELSVLRKDEQRIEREKKRENLATQWERVWVARKLAVDMLAQQQMYI